MGYVSNTPTRKRAIFGFLPRQLPSSSCIYTLFTCSQATRRLRGFWPRGFSPRCLIVRFSEGCLCSELDACVIDIWFGLRACANYIYYLSEIYIVNGEWIGNITSVLFTHPNYSKRWKWAQKQRHIYRYLARVPRANGATEREEHDGATM